MASWSWVLPSASFGRGKYLQVTQLRCATGDWKVSLVLGCSHNARSRSLSGRARVQAVLRGRDAPRPAVLPGQAWTCGLWLSLEAGYVLGELDKDPAQPACLSHP